jgi:ATP-dependent Lon protease
VTFIALAFTKEGLETIIDHYTREAGVRGLEREIAAVCRDASVRAAEGKLTGSLAVTPETVREVLGPEKHRPEISERKLSPGVAVGLGASGSGGDLLIVEATRMPGKGEIYITGGMRSVMKESAETAMSFVRSRADRLRLEPEFLRSIDLHLHVPRAAAVRDAASAGVAMFVAVSSLLLGISVRPDVAVTGELTLRGSILPVNSLKEQILAAHRAGVREVLVPERNRRDYSEVPEEIRTEMTVHFVTRLDQVLPLVLVNNGEPGAASDVDAAPPSGDDAHA